MIKLENKTNVTPPGLDYPYGNIKDDTGVGDGTPVDQEVYADIHQFFAHMFGLAGITANNLPDNATNGFQLYDAFKKHCARGFPGDPDGAWMNAGTPVISANAGATVSVYPSTMYNRFKIFGKTFIWEMKIGLRVDSGKPTMITVQYPTHADIPFAIKPAHFTGAPHLSLSGFYNTTPAVLWCNENSIDIYRYPSNEFDSLPGRPLQFSVMFEIQ